MRLWPNASGDAVRNEEVQLRSKSIAQGKVTILVYVIAARTARTSFDDDSVQIIPLYTRCPHSNCLKTSAVTLHYHRRELPKGQGERHKSGRDTKSFPDLPLRHLTPREHIGPCVWNNKYSDRASWKIPHPSSTLHLSHHYSVSARPPSTKHIRTLR